METFIIILGVFLALFLPVFYYRMIKIEDTITKCAKGLSNTIERESKYILMDFATSEVRAAEAHRDLLAAVHSLALFDRTRVSSDGDRSMVTVIGYVWCEKYGDVHENILNPYDVIDKEDFCDDEDHRLLHMYNGEIPS